MATVEDDQAQINKDLNNVKETYDEWWQEAEWNEEAETEHAAGLGEICYNCGATGHYARDCRKPNIYIHE